jgi:hypothetical protein
MTATIPEQGALFGACNSTSVIHNRGQRATQPPLFSRSVCDPGVWRHGHRQAAWQEIARALPANLGLEYTANGWRIITVPHEMRRALEALDIAEGDVIPDDVMRERRRRVTEAELLVAQAKAVLRAVNLELQAKAA